MRKSVNFSIKELVCEHVYNKYGENAWNFFDDRLIETLDFIREKIGKPITINNWSWSGSSGFTQRGLRCNICELVKSKTLKNQPYLTAHSRGIAVDFDVKGMTAKEVRQWLVQNAEALPYPIYVEDDVTWVHLDLRSKPGKKVYLFKP